MKYLAHKKVIDIFGGVPLGQRFNGAITIAIAARKDGIHMNKAKELMKEYVMNCKALEHPFTVDEALNALAWAYKEKSSELKLVLD